MRYLFIVFILGTTLNSFSQHQSFISSKNEIYEVGGKMMEPIVSEETKRISFVLTEGNSYKTLIISPEIGIDGNISLQLMSTDQTTKSGKIEKTYYSAIENNKEKRTVIVTTEDEVLISITIILKIGDSILEWTFLNIKPVYNKY